MQGQAETDGLPLFGKRLANILGKPFGVNPFPRTFPPHLKIPSTTRSGVFDRIYRDNSWNSSESKSGVGSEERRVSAYRQRLRKCLEVLGARRLFDAPCGDLNWILPIARDPSIAYRGGDIAASLVEAIRSQFPELEIDEFDICQDAFPEADVWHCRDCLFHLPFADIRRAFANFAKSTIPFALLTTHSARLHRNLDVDAGGFRYLDLERAPMSFPKSPHYLRDYRAGLDFPRYVGVWTREQVKSSVENWAV